VTPSGSSASSSKRSSKRALVAGVGAIGGWLLARLTEGGADVTGWARGQTYAQLAAGEPFVLRSKDGDWSGAVRVVDRPDTAYDYTFVVTKSAATGDAAQRLVRGGVAISVQNGLDNPSVLAAAGGWDRVVPTVVYCGCNRVDAVTVRHTSNGYLVLDDAEVADWLNAHGLRARLVADVAPVQWAKLAGNVVQNSLTAVLDTLQGPMRDHPALQRVQRDLCDEVRRVGVACGVALPPDFTEAVLAGLQRLPDHNGTSMLWDRRAGRALEVDALTGAVLRRAADQGVDVPVVRTVDALVRFVSDSASGAVKQPECG
jgi:2-dehydropantoate 2-reductase